jgi:hypothetical protein
MNRIYQGKVTAVEIPDGKDEQDKPKWKKLDDWQPLLWQHHELFQDAVNYYTLALAAMAAGLEPNSPDAYKREITRTEIELEEIKKAKKTKNKPMGSDLDEKKAQVEEQLEKIKTKESILEWREQVAKAWKDGVERGGQHIVWPRKNLHCWLAKLDATFDPHTATFDDVCKSILKFSKASKEQQAEAFQFLLNRAASKSEVTLGPFAQDKLPWLCNESSENLTDEATKSKQRLAAKLAVSKLVAEDDMNIGIQGKNLNPGLFSTKQKTQNGDEGKRGVLDAFDQAVNFQNKPKSSTRFTPNARFRVDEKTPTLDHKSALIELLKTLPDDFTINTTAGRPQGEYKFATLLCGICSADESKIVPEQKANASSLKAAAIASFRIITKNLAEKDVKVVLRDYLKEARTSEDKRQFDYFTNLAMKRAEDIQVEKEIAEDADTDWENEDVEENESEAKQARSEWTEFDFTAFVEALKSPHRHLQDTLKRKKACDQLKKRLKRIKEGEGEAEQENEDGETSERFHGFKGDHRVEGKNAENKGIEQLIHDPELLAYLEEDEADAKAEYGINENTLRGWSELRRQWREAWDKPEYKNNPLALKNELDRLRRTQQGKQPEESGSGGLFKRLQEPEYHCIWRDNPPNPEIHADDPLEGVTN